MRYPKVIFLIIFALNLLNISLVAQVNISSISLKVGYIRTFSLEEGSRYTFTPDFQIGGLFLKEYLNWIAYWSYWNDKIDEVTWKDGLIYSYSSHIFGCRMAFSPMKVVSNWYVPIDVFGGISYHFIKRKYIGGEDYQGNIGTNYTTGTTTGEIGISLYFEIINSIDIVAEAYQYLPFGDGEYDQLQKDRRAYKIGLKYSF